VPPIRSARFRLIVPFAAGGAVDSVARVLGKALSANLGGSIVIDNRGGAGGVIGMEAVRARGPPTAIRCCSRTAALRRCPGSTAICRSTRCAISSAVVTAASGAYVLAVNAAEPFTSVADLVAYAKANPGRLTYGSAGAGSIIHLAGEFFKRTAAVELVHVPYKGAAPAITDLVGGQIRMMFAPAVNALPLAASGTLRALAVTSAKRSRLAPGLPTVAESGLPGFEVTGWYGLAAPAATAASAVARLNAETNRALASADTVEQLRQQGLEPVGDTPEQASAWIRSEGRAMDQGDPRRRHQAVVDRHHGPEPRARCGNP